MELKIYDNFLSKEEFLNLKSNIVFNTNFPFFLHDGITQPNDSKGKYDGFATHVIYDGGLPVSPLENFYNEIGSIFFPNFDNMRSILRIKINFYPHTNKVVEHKSHIDYDFSHTAAIFSLNTCDGYTKIGNNDIVDSIENRIVFFDGSKYHNSTTTSNALGRFNISFNYH